MKAEIWTKQNCPYCVRAKALFDKRGVEYVEHIIGGENMMLKENQHAATREALLEKAPNARTVPQIWLDGAYIGGYTELAAFWGVN